MKKMIGTGLWALLLTGLLTVPAWAQELIVGGQAVGIQLETEGVLVAGVSEVQTPQGAVSPAAEAGLQAGDLITAVDGWPVADAPALMDAVAAAGEERLALSVRRGEQALTLSVEPAVSEDGRPMLGILLRDALSGIGTLTFCDPESGRFGALGHSVNDGSTGLTIPLRGGVVTDAQIFSVQPGAPGKPGELGGVSDLGAVLGRIDRNSDAGVFGFLYDSPDGQLLEIGSITAGPASIVATVDGRQRREFAVEVNRVYRDADGTHAMLSVTDSALLARTGGIVQGMSGSPILQNGRLVGAVTHVFVSNPARGYAVSIQDMLRAAGITPEKAA
ncbi:MAG: PDZ domain-containing protein [Oscillospiraceae bacterium]|nr:PDZ domain-containing protein [Oscillospiraceae bacterium]